jgi:hypothetical protein
MEGYVLERIDGEIGIRFKQAPYWHNVPTSDLKCCAFGIAPSVVGLAAFLARRLGSYATELCDNFEFRY